MEGFKFENAIETVRIVTVVLILTRKTKHEDIIRKVANAYNMTMKIPLTEITYNLLVVTFYVSKVYL